MTNDVLKFDFCITSICVRSAAFEIRHSAIHLKRQPDKSRGSSLVGVNLKRKATKK